MFFDTARCTWTHMPKLRSEKSFYAGQKDVFPVGSTRQRRGTLHVNPGSRVTTVDYNVPLCNDCHPRLQTMHVNVLMQRRTPAGYSHIVSYSSIEHDGLGRYGGTILGGVVCVQLNAKSALCLIILVLNRSY